ncbi:MAG: methyltransferase domain-containing protein [Candidatus Nitrosopelagicus sp.]|nr:methyltransferase domain-containing protein [Candidatus Nitrosopelagicus sp.]
MNRNNSQFIFCVKCKGKLSLEILDEWETMIKEGFFSCSKCHLKYPIISKIPILVEDLTQFFTNRPFLGKWLIKSSLTNTMKKFIKNKMSIISKSDFDLSAKEAFWTEIYRNNKNSIFYKNIKFQLSKLPPKNFVIEYGSSIGAISNTLALKHKQVFGIDKSFFALVEASKKSPKNCVYILSDAIKHPFGNKKFDLVVALNLFDIVEPSLLIKTISKQISNGLIFLSDPYDYDRGKNSVKRPLGENQIRATLSQNGFQITKNTKKPTKITWNIKFNERISINYKVDVIIASKSS